MNSKGFYTISNDAAQATYPSLADALTEARRRLESGEASAVYILQAIELVKIDPPPPLPTRRTKLETPPEPERDEIPF